jgi:N-acetyl-gamma-glutamyl-phosphate reductase
MFAAMNVEQVAVVGATGYSGEELVRILSRHPLAELVCLTSRQNAGKPLDAIYPRFRQQRFGGLKFVPSETAAVVASGATSVFLALPHGVAAEFAGALLEAGLRVIDLSADFRLKDPEVYRDYYDVAHPAPALLRRSVYGMPEVRREEIRKADFIAAPGCYPTSAIIPLCPLLERGLLEPESIVITSLSAVSGAGRKADLDYSYVECSGSARAYSVPKHRHIGEIEQELTAAADKKVTVNFTPILVPLSRGILTTIYATPAPGVSAAGISEAMNDRYGKEPFVRLLGADQYPDIKNVAHTNFIDVAWRHDPRTGRVILLSAIDNLVKGASGQAVQCLNLMRGWDEAASL